MRKIYITESQLLEMALLKEVGEQTPTATQTSSVSQNQEETKATDSNGEQNNDITVSKNGNMSQISLSKKEIDKGIGKVKSDIRSTIGDNQLNPKNLYVTYDSDGDGNVGVQDKNTIPFATNINSLTGGSGRINSELNRKESEAGVKRGVLEPTIPGTQFMSECKTLTKKQIKEARRNYLLDNSSITTKRDINNFLKK